MNARGRALNLLWKTVLVAVFWLVALIWFLVTQQYAWSWIASVGLSVCVALMFVQWLCYMDLRE